MSSSTIKLKLPYAQLDAIEGSGGELTFKVRGQRTKKTGVIEFYELELKVCRYGVKRLLEGLREMHVRDRERIKNEQERIAIEANVLVRQ